MFYQLITIFIVHFNQFPISYLSFLTFLLIFPWHTTKSIIYYIIEIDLYKFMIGWACLPTAVTVDYKFLGNQKFAVSCHGSFLFVINILSSIYQFPYFRRRLELNFLYISRDFCYYFNSYIFVINKE